MKTVSMYYHILKADFLERVRSYSFLIIIGLTIISSYYFVPGINASYITINFQGYRGFYDSAFLGGMVTILTTTFLSLAGFYLVKNTITRDIRSGVGQIIAATPISNWQYLLGKVLSNFTVLVIMIGIISFSTMFMQIIKGETLQLNLWSLFSPFVIIGLPVMFFVAVIAVIFEIIPKLRSGLGNIIYFVLWLFFVSFPSFIPVEKFDLLGMNLLLKNMVKSLQSVYPSYSGGIPSIGFVLKKDISVEVFKWSGLNCTIELLMWRIFWVVLALMILFLVKSLFKRFNETTAEINCQENDRVDSDNNKDLESKKGLKINKDIDHFMNVVSSSNYNFCWHLWLEIKLLSKGLPLWFYLIAVGIITISLVRPGSNVYQWLILSWIWPLLIWSKMGVREKINRTDQIVFSTPYPVLRQLLMSWLAGIIITVVIGSGVAVRLIISNNLLQLFLWGISVFLIPTLALCLGILSSSPKLFEVIYILLWFLGPVNKVPIFDFMGISEKAVDMGIPYYYLVITILLIIFSVMGRSRAVKSA